MSMSELSLIQQNGIEKLDDKSIILKDQELFMKQALRFQELMMMYDCAVKEVKTKLEVLNAELSVRYKRNPIEFVNTRIKKPVSIAKKLVKKGKNIDVDEIEETIHDVGGIRVICSYIDDIYEIASMLIRQDDIILIEQKDYIDSPKESGYRSLHLIIEIPVYFSDQTKNMKVEVQIRTIAMDFWASLEHKLRYKKDLIDAQDIIEELKDCAEVISSTDHQMLNIRNKIEERYNNLDREDNQEYENLDPTQFI